MDFCRETFKGHRDMDARLQGGTEKREEHLFPDGEGGNVRRSDGGETRSWKPKVSSSLVEKRDQVVQVSSGREGRERGRSTDPRGAALMGGHVWR